MIHQEGQVFIISFNYAKCCEKNTNLFLHFFKLTFKPYEESKCHGFSCINCGIEKYETKQGVPRVCVCQWCDCASVCFLLFIVCAAISFFVLLQQPEALHYKWRGGSPAMQTTLTQGEHETPPFNRVHSNVTWLRERWESNASNVSFIHQEAALMLALEPVSHSVLQHCPKLGFLFERRRKKDIGVAFGL